ncbi:MAG: TIGR00304 family protein [Methanobacteriaceae archaeon]|nr:TIGR00304 family protein [Methanobacteriaceae archaeon]
MIKGESLIFIGIAAVILGILLIFIGSAVLSSGKNEGHNEVKTGGIILIGPIPIIFGNDRNTVLTVSLVAIIIMVIFYLLFYRGST